MAAPYDDNPRKTMRHIGKSSAMAASRSILLHQGRKPSFTGWPPAFEAAARLGRAREAFCLYVDGEVVWVCTLERTRGRKVGRGSHGKRRWREWWRKLAIVPSEAGGSVNTDWFKHDMRVANAREIGVTIYEADKLPENVHILDADAPARSQRP